MATISEVNADKTIYSELNFDTKYAEKPEKTDLIYAKKCIDDAFNNFDFAAHKMCVAGSFYVYLIRTYHPSFQVFAFDKFMPLIEHLKPKEIYVSVNSIVFIVNGYVISIILKKEFISANPIELVSKFKFSACEVYYDGEMHFTARAKFTFETCLLFTDRTENYTIFDYATPSKISLNPPLEVPSINMCNINYLKESKYDELIGRFDYDEFMQKSV